MPLSPDSPAMAAWSQILDEFEHELESADEVQLSGSAEESETTAVIWSAPLVDPGELPEDQRERAERVLAAQRRALARLEDLRGTVVQHIRATRRATTQDTTRSAYLDIAG